MASGLSFFKVFFFFFFKLYFKASLLNWPSNWHSQERTSPDGQHWNQIDNILWSQRWRSYIEWAKTRPGDDCVSDHEFLHAKFRLKLKKVGENIRPFRYDINQILYDYIVEVRNRFKGPDLTDRVPEGLWTEVHYIVKEIGIKTISKKKKCQKAKWLSE